MLKAELEGLLNDMGPQDLQGVERILLLATNINSSPKQVQQQSRQQQQQMLQQQLQEVLQPQQRPPRKLTDDFGEVNFQRLNEVVQGTVASFAPALQSIVGLRRPARGGRNQQADQSRRHSQKSQQMQQPHLPTEVGEHSHDTGRKDVHCLEQVATQDNNASTRNSEEQQRTSVIQLLQQMQENFRKLLSQLHIEPPVQPVQPQQEEQKLQQIQQSLFLLRQILEQPQGQGHPELQQEQQEQQEGNRELVRPPHEGQHSLLAQMMQQLEQHLQTLQQQPRTPQQRQFQQLLINLFSSDVFRWSIQIMNEILNEELTDETDAKELVDEPSD